MREEDGLQALLALLPCQSRRALVLIDSSYEIKSDYKRVIETAIKALQKMANTVLIIWYPVVERSRIRWMEKQLVMSGIPHIQQYELGVRADDDALGMTSAGVFVINPPWTLMTNMKKILPDLAKRLSEDGALHVQCRTLVEQKK